MKLIDIDAIRIPKGFFEEVNNVPKLYEWLEKQPTIDSIKYGRWVMQGTAYGCSLCGEGVIHLFHNYCPNCGAKIKWNKKRRKEYENEEMSKVSEMEMAYAESLND